MYKFEYENLRSAIYSNLADSTKHSSKTEAEAMKNFADLARCKVVSMIPIAERDNKRCYFCDAKLSVKYLVEVDMPTKAPVPFRVHACNMCAPIKIR